MTDLIVKVTLRADGSGLVGQVRPAVASLKDLAQAETTAGSAGQAMATGTAAAGAAARGMAEAGRQASAAASEVADTTRQASAAASGLASDARQAAQALGGAGDAAQAMAAGAGVARAATADLAGAGRDASAATVDLQGSTRQAAAAAADLAGGTRQVADASADLADGSRQAAQALDGAAAAGRSMAAGTDAAGTAARDLAGAGRQASDAADDLTGSTRQAASAASELVGDTRQAAQALEDLRGAQDRSRRELDNTRRSAGQVSAGYQQLGFQIQDLGASVGGGTSVLQAMSQQLGQIFGALQLIGPSGAGGKFVTFMGGPWGAVIGAAAAILLPLIANLWETEKASEAATAGNDALAEAQSALGEIFNLTSGAIKDQNELLLLNARYTAIKLRAEAEEKRASSDKALFAAGKAQDGQMYGAAIALGAGQPLAARYMLEGNPQVRLLAQRVREADAIKDDNVRRARLDQLLQISAGTDYKDSRVSKSEMQQAILDRATIRRNDRVADAIDLSLDTEKLDPMFRRDAPRTRTRTPPSTAARDEFGRDAADKIAGIVDQFDDAPSVVDKINGKVRELTDLMDDLGRRKPPNFAALIESAEAAKVTVRDGLIRQVADAFDKPQTLADKAGAAIADLDAVIADLSKKKPLQWEESIAGAREAKTTIEEALNRPLDEYLKQQREGLQVQALVNAGRLQEAEVLREVQRIERERGRLSADQVQLIRDAVRERREEERVADRMHRGQLLMLDAVRDVGDAIDDATQAWVRGDLREFLKTPAKLLDAAQTLEGRELFEGLFGEAFAELEREITEGPVEKASRRMGGEMDKASAQVATFAGVVAAAADAIARGEPIDPNDIVVTGSKLPPAEPADPRGVVERALSGVATEIADVFGSREFAEQLGADIGAASAAALKGAAQGAQVAGVADWLGFGKQIDANGAKMGGALAGGVANLFGYSLTPLGGILAGALGGAIGSMIKGPTRSGYAAIGTDANGNVSSAISGGRNSDGRRTEALGYAGNVLDGLQQIAASLGGRLGSGLDLGTIGTQGDKFVFDQDGAGRGAGIKVDTLEEAVTAALSSAVGKGAVTGLSEAVRKALGSSDDLDKALAEALQVKELEQSLSGVGGEIAAMFADFDNVAAERVRLARTYGLDLLAVEKRNAEERTQLLDDALRSRVGSLQQLLDDMRYGDLFEGDAADRRSQILAEIEEAKADADAGAEGAAERLSELYRLLMDTTRENYGTAGTEYAGDRASAAEGAAAVIKTETDRINAAAAAQRATADALAAGNRLTDETNDLMARANATLTSIDAQLARGGIPTTGAAVPATVRQTSLT